MRKRKFPWIPASVLIVLVGAIAAFNMSGGMAGPEGGHDHSHGGEATSGQQPEAQPVAGSGTPAPTIGNKDAMAKSLEQSAKVSPGGPGAPQGPSPGRPVVAKEPSKPYRPEPTENMTSSQWYAPEYANTTKKR